MDAVTRKQQPGEMATPAVRPPPPSYIYANSPFSPRQTECCQCQERTFDQQLLFSDPKQKSQQRPLECGPCGHKACECCRRFDARNKAVLPHAFPTDWVCSTCGEAHSVAEILLVTRRRGAGFVPTGRFVECECGKPTLQAVYDQFGRIFLFWRDDPAVYDLTVRSKVAEAASRIMEAGARPWDDEIWEYDLKKKVDSVVGRQRNREKESGWNRLSHSSVSSEDSLDIAMAAAAARNS